MIAGHAYYYLQDVYPQMTGRQPLKTPALINALFPRDEIVVVQPANAMVAPPQDLQLN